MFGYRVCALFSTVVLGGCVTLQDAQRPVCFKADLAFLQEHTEKLVVLTDTSGKAQVAVSPALQGRVMTSTAAGGEGDSYGWINRELIASGEVRKHINAYGGEDRFWIGPEGGQFSVFFEKGVSFDLDHWHTPAPIDTEAFKMVSKTKGKLSLRKDMELTNYSGRTFALRVDRDVRVLERDDVATALGIEPADTVQVVGFESRNMMTNTGTSPWKKETGLLSIWMLGMFNPSPGVTVVIPFIEGDKAELGPVVNDAYFGAVSEDRQRVKDGVVYFSGDGMSRGKIGLSPERAKPVLGSYDPMRKLLTIVQYNKPNGARDYVNSMWALQEAPYRGDVVNAYNDGPPTPDAEPLGPFYELETSSPASTLGVGGTVTHIHRTLHLSGTEDALDPIARKLLGVGIDDIKQALQSE